MQECYGAAAPSPGPWPRTPPTTGCWSAWTPAPLPAAPVGADLSGGVRQPGRPGVHRHLSGASAVRAGRIPRSPCGTWPPCTRTWNGRSRTRSGRVRLEGDIAAVRRVANPLQVGMAGETHFLFGDDRLAHGARNSSGRRPGTACSPRDPVTVGQIRGWIDAMRPRTWPARRGGRPDRAGLGRAAAAGLVPARGHPSRRPGPERTRPDMQLRPEPLPVPADWQAATSRAEVLVRDPGQSLPDRGGPRRVYRKPAGAPGCRWPTPPRALAQRVELAYRHLGLPADRPRGRLATARAGATLVETLQRAGSRVHLVEILARTSVLPATDTAIANSLSRAQAVASAVDTFRWDRLAPLRAAESQADDRGRGAARALTALREAVAG